jgi:hypothetical protein
MTLDPPRRNPPKKIYARFRHPDAKPITRCTVNGKPHKNFNPEKEWVVIKEACSKPVEIVAYYN